MSNGRCCKINWSTTRNYHTLFAWFAPEVWFWYKNGHRISNRIVELESSTPVRMDRYGIGTGTRGSTGRRSALVGAFGFDLDRWVCGTGGTREPLCFKRDEYEQEMSTCGKFYYSVFDNSQYSTIYWWECSSWIHRSSFPKATMPFRKL